MTLFKNRCKGTKYFSFLQTFRQLFFKKISEKKTTTHKPNSTITHFQHFTVYKRTTCEYFSHPNSPKNSNQQHNSHYFNQVPKKRPNPPHSNSPNHPTVTDQITQQ